MVKCGSYMHKFSVSKNIIFLNNDRRKEVATRGGNRESGGAFVSNTYFQRIEN
jgi:hypothetical protein